MCFALPLKVKSIEGKKAQMEDGRKVKLSIVENAKIGDYLLVQSDLAVEKLKKSEAKSMRSAISEVNNELRKRN